jgi:hypothetical protein
LEPELGLLIVSPGCKYIIHFTFGSAKVEEDLPFGWENIFVSAVNEHQA